MKFLNRLLLLILSIALLSAAYATHTGMKQLSFGHETYYLQKWTWLSQVHQVALYGVLIWCLLFAKSEPTCVRIGLGAVILTLILLALPPATVDPSALFKAWH
jgi:isoprenylcysteine carboxyl methyltransferase (ICMT) family protein YpbQ